MAEQKAVRWERGEGDLAGIAVVVLDDPARSVNTLNEAYVAGMDGGARRAGGGEGGAARGDRHLGQEDLLRRRPTWRR